jgi:amino acid adenylation domain-containing protein
MANVMAANISESQAAKIIKNPSGKAALHLNGRDIAFGELRDMAMAFARAFTKGDPGPLSLVAIVVEKTFESFSAILGAHLAGLGYVPLNPKQPTERMTDMLEQSGTRILVGGGVATRALLGNGAPELQVVSSDASELDRLNADFPAHEFRLARPGTEITPAAVPPDALAYLLFTSGTTGRPKGVPVSFSNLDSYVNAASALLGLGPDDRCSQTFNLNFDLSVHDIFVTWAAGACLYPLNETNLLAPARFLREHELTSWFSVPAVAMMMQRTRTVRPGLFPSLRHSLFCGEALPEATAEDWARAAPNSRLMNLYGPTEATIAITCHEWLPGAGSGRFGLVPIGRAIGEQRTHLLDEAGALIKGPGRGELALEGDQVTRGYLNAPDQTAAAYVPVPGSPNAHCYRTGDLVERDGNGLLHYVGRLDSQIKLRGHRIELQEIDRVLRSASGLDLAVAVAMPANGPVQEIVGVVASADLDTQGVLDRCKAHLPDAMLPARIVALGDLPLNANGKIDRKAVATMVATR